MKKILSTTLVALLIGFASVAQDDKIKVTEEKKVAPNPNGAEMSFEQEVHDFGTLPYGGDGGFDFKFTNSGKEPLVITNARGSCGCTVPSWPKEPILKGHSASIHVQYDTKRPGPFTKTVTITSNAKDGDKVITIKGTVESKEQTENGTPVRKDNPMSPKENTSTGFGIN
jgi:hypothetical protein